MCFLRRAFSQAIHAFRHFHEAFLAFALFATGRGNFYAQRLGAIEQRCADGGIAVLEVKV